MADESRIPRVIVEPSAFSGLPLAPVDGFILSRIDGRATERALAGLTGLSESQVRSTLEKLLGLKVITFKPVGEQESVKKLPAATPAAAVEDQAGNALLAAAIAAVPDNAPELTEEVDLPADLRRSILGLHQVLNSLDHYAILGIERDSDKKAVRRQYFALAAIYHPDRYFRKNLGSFKLKMETIFAKVTAASDVLSDKAQRADYDAYLGDVERSRAVEAMLRNVMSEVETAQQTALEEAGAPEEPAAVAELPPASTTPRPPAGPKPGSVSDQLRREALAKRLGGGRPVPKPAPPVTKVTPVPAVVTREAATGAVDALRRRYQERIEASRRHQAEKYCAAGAGAEERKDLVAAAVAYRVALTFLREGEPLFVKANQVIAKADVQLGETYVRQARHEEQHKRWEDASKSWTRAAKLRPTDPVVHERAANALTKSAGDLHQAAQFAKTAVAIEPNNAEYRCTLAAVYIAAGLHLNARRELEAAAPLAVDDANIQALMKKLTVPPTA